LQVIVVALVLSFIIKRDSEVIDYEDAFGKMKTVDHINLKGKRYLDDQSEIFRCFFSVSYSKDITAISYKRHVSRENQRHMDSVERPIHLYTAKHCTFMCVFLTS